MTTRDDLSAALNALNACRFSGLNNLETQNVKRVRRAKVIIERVLANTEDKTELINQELGEYPIG
jgi:hypothetical protein